MEERAESRPKMREESGAVESAAAVVAASDVRCGGMCAAWKLDRAGNAADSRATDDNNAGKAEVEDDEGEAEHEEAMGGVVAAVESIRECSSSACCAMCVTSARPVGC